MTTTPTPARRPRNAARRLRDYLHQCPAGRVLPWDKIAKDTGLDRTEVVRTMNYLRVVGANIEVMERAKKWRVTTDGAIVREKRVNASVASLPASVDDEHGSRRSQRTWDVPDDARLVILHHLSASKLLVKDSADRLYVARLIET